MKSTILAFVVVLLLVCFLLVVAKSVSARRVKDVEKSSPFECGFDPYGSGRFPFSLQFFLVAILFLLFDLEIALIYPLATFKAGYMSVSASISSFMFLIIVLFGLIHEWNEGSLQWKS
uniref:NADH-ubiquinone oxidoreductase chain 3 n=1 Tax=Lottia digitalis TaxID=225159 RepID=Q2I6Z8_9GAST|nr:NADH dehydrogenase subunit 3 [Lottia digitalis]ABC00937.1 NADH dehydrogenase subunit 3 [Lottia digitalis]